MSETKINEKNELVVSLSAPDFIVLAVIMGLLVLIYLHMLLG